MSRQNSTCSQVIYRCDLCLLTLCPSVQKQRLMVQDCGQAQLFIIQLADGTWSLCLKEESQESPLPLTTAPTQTLECPTEWTMTADPASWVPKNI